MCCRWRPESGAAAPMASVAGAAKVRRRGQISGTLAPLSRPVHVAVLPGRVEADAVQHVLCKPLRHLVVVLRVGLEGD